MIRVIIGAITRLIPPDYASCLPETVAIPEWFSLALD